MQTMDYFVFVMLLGEKPNLVVVVLYLYVHGGIVMFVCLWCLLYYH